MKLVWLTLSSIAKKTASNEIDAAKFRLERNNFSQISFQKYKGKGSRRNKEKNDDDDDDDDGDDAVKDAYYRSRRILTSTFGITIASNFGLSRKFSSQRV